jgi:hypothetical protein
VTDLAVQIRERVAADSLGVFSAVLPAASFKRKGSEFYVECPFHPDEDPSLRINPSKGVWRCDPCDAGGDVFALYAGMHNLGGKGDFPAVVKGLARLLGIATNGDASAARAQARERAGSDHRGVEVVGDPTDAQVEALVRARRISRRETLERVGARLVRYSGAEWLGLPTVASTWKLLALDAVGRPRLDDRGRITRLNIGRVGIVAPLDLRGRTAGELKRLYDVEGESDLLALLDVGAFAAISTTGGATSLAGHDADREFLLSLRPSEVVVVRDLDEAGRNGARSALAWWQQAGVRVRALELPADLGDGGDVRDFLCGRPAENGEPARPPLGTLANLESLISAAASAQPSVGILISTVRAERVEWLWDGRIPSGKPTILDGDPGLGKSTLTIEIAARVSRGEPLPGDDSRREAAGVVILSAEDGLADTIRPRLEAAGADLERIIAVPTVRTLSGEEVLPEIPRDLPLIEHAIREVRAGLLIIDPLMAFLSAETNAHRDQDVRRALAPLAKLAEKTAVAALVVRHLNKRSGGEPLYRGGGSIGIIGAARSGLLVAQDPDHESRRVLALLKSNLAKKAPSLAFELEEIADVVRIRWLGESVHSATRLMAIPESEEERSSVDAAVEVLRQILLGGAVTAENARKQARAAGVSDRTLDRAKARLGVRAVKRGFSGSWEWELPEADPKSAKPPEGRQAEILGALRDPGTPRGEKTSGNTEERQPSPKSANPKNASETYTERELWDL